MSKPRNVSNKSRRLQICLVLIASAVGISAIIFVACKERIVFILPGLVFLMASFTFRLFGYFLIGVTGADMIATVNYCSNGGGKEGAFGSEHSV